VASPGVIYCLFGVSAVGSILSNIAGYFIEKKQKEAMAKILEKKVTREDFEKFDVDGDGKIEKTEFALRKLMLMGLIKIEDIAMVEKEFEIMDADGSGEIDFVRMMRSPQLGEKLPMPDRASEAKRSEAQKRARAAQRPSSLREVERAGGASDRANNIFFCASGAGGSSVSGDQATFVCARFARPKKS
jgi:Ca2+-binding EF-hand superfamily protein